MDRNFFPEDCFNGLMQKRHNSIANTLELHLLCIKPLISPYSPLIIASGPALVTNQLISCWHEWTDTIGVTTLAIEILRNVLRSYQPFWIVSSGTQSGRESLGVRETWEKTCLTFQSAVCPLKAQQPSVLSCLQANSWWPSSGHVCIKNQQL